MAGKYATVLMLRGVLNCSSFSAYFTINLRGAAEHLQADVRSKAAIIGVWGWPALPIKKTRREKVKSQKPSYFQSADF